MLHNVSGMLDRMRPAEMDALEAYDNVHGIGLSRSIFDFERGSAEAKDAFKKLGISFRMLRG